jgi:glycosyltransferase involved in cell wall biosynthesis
VRVVHLTSSHAPDDVRIFLKECRSLAQAGNEVHLVAPNAEEEERDGVAVHGFDLPGGPRPVRIARRLWRVWRVARRIEADVCQFHEPELVPVALLLQLGGARTVYDVHEEHVNALAYSPLPMGGRRFGFRLLEALARKKCHAFVAATPAIARQFPPARTIEVRNYPVLEEFQDASADRGPGGNPVYIGMITQARGLLEMVEAIRSVRHPEARLILLGGFDSPETERVAKALPGWERVEYQGQVSRERVRERLAEASVGIVVFHPERDHVGALPNKLFEYMAAGLPLIASDFPLWRELLDPVGCAVHVDPLDPAQLAVAIDDLLESKERAREMGFRGREAVHERLNWAQEFPKLLELYVRLDRAA